MLKHTSKLLLSIDIHIHYSHMKDIVKEIVKVMNFVSLLIV